MNCYRSKLLSNSEFGPSGMAWYKVPAVVVGMQQAQYLFYLTFELIEKTECKQVKMLIILLMPI